MELKLTIYTDDTLTEVKREVTADKLKIPYRVGMYVGQSLETVDLKSEDDIYKFVVNSLGKLDKVIKATFGVTDAELECVDLMELGAVGVELYKWGIDKLNSLKGNNPKNVVTTANN